MKHNLKAEEIRKASLTAAHGIGWNIGVIATELDKRIASALEELENATIEKCAKRCEAFVFEVTSGKGGNIKTSTYAIGDALAKELRELKSAQKEVKSEN